jgi:UDP-N-acetylglucosamine--N-acetylmuramyl-(pentapeptide) pyrophosphoryl-undecaprenol N-acetylglucosamine transferase
VFKSGAKTVSVFAVVAGGGTAGHVLPGIAIARALEERGHTVHYVGAERGLEARLLPAERIDHTLLPGRGIQRRLTLANLGAIAGIVRAFFAALGLLRRLGARVVIGVGGYASVPCVLAGIVLRIPIVVAEQNTHPGAANRLAARFAKASAVSFPGTPLPRAVVTGNPVRPDIAAIDRARDGSDAKAALGAPTDRLLVLVAGGSLGALSINRAVLELVTGPWRDRRDVAVRHVVGDRDWASIGAEPPELPADGVVYTPVRYESAMPTALTAADVGVFRSGSSMCFEIAAAGLPSILVPSPNVTGDHQTGNARLLADVGAAVLLPDAELGGARLATELDALIGDADRRDAMAAAVRGFARPHAADEIAELAEEHAR